MQQGKSGVAPNDEQLYFSGLWPGEEKGEDNDRGKQEKGNLGIFLFSLPPHGSAMLFPSLVKL